MTSRDELTYNTLSNISDRIRERMPQGSAAAASLEINGNQLLGNDYIYYLDKGRGPGKFPPPENIEAWAKKNFGLDDKEAKQMAYVVGRKIAREGTEIFKDNSKGIMLDMIVEDEIEKLTKELVESETVEVLKWL